MFAAQAEAARKQREDEERARREAEARARAEAEAAAARERALREQMELARSVATPAETGLDCHKCKQKVCVICFLCAYGCIFVA